MLKNKNRIEIKIYRVDRRMELLKIEDSKKKGKRLTAIFKEKDKIKKVDFGAEKGNTYIDHKDKIKRKAYIERHSNNPLEKPYLNKKKYSDKPANLAMEILWGKSSNIKENIKNYKKKYDV